MNKINKAKVNYQENFVYELRDKAGNIKKLFKDGFLNTAIVKFVRARYNPYNEAGEVKSGLLAKIALFGVRIPFITGMWVERMSVANLITSAGKAGLASRVNGNGAEAAFTYIAIGIGTTAAAVGNTALESEITTAGGQRANSTASRTTTTVTNDTARLVNTFTFTGSFNVTEAGVLNAGSTGTLLNRQVFTAVAVASGDSLQITVDVSNA
ncbi:MAG: hypothetical protein UR99_C0017G0026 [Candidatus Moranbacteria bacterium GW2011_GWD2_36_12]|nr:MAG: hypothetical protein UR99_C0017G0026 [Candidatus Moranbacteria bacterium GW2011_GWD2_36_12]